VFVRAEFLAGAWWQLLTAQWVHLSWAHGLANAVGFAALLVAFWGHVAPRWLVAAAVGGQLGVAVVLALDTHCAWYAGASGALHGLAAGAALALLLQRPSQTIGRLPPSWLGAGVLAGLAIKLVWQHGTGAQPGWLGFPTYTPAHEAGALGGLVAVAGLYALQRTAAARRTHPGAGGQ
jgi:rhomboid family GlyGly-CTERM serine protease